MAIKINKRDIKVYPDIYHHEPFMNIIKRDVRNIQRLFISTVITAQLIYLFYLVLAPLI